MLLIGIAGGSGSGKTTLSRKLIDYFPQGMVSLLQMDSYYKDQGKLSRLERTQFNFDHPNAIDFDLLLEHIHLLKEQHPIIRPNYSFLTCHRTKQTFGMKPSPIVILEGLFVLTEKQIRDKLTTKIFLNASLETRLNRTILRDMEQRGRSKTSSYLRFLSIVEPMHQEFVQPCEQFADVVLDADPNDINMQISKLLELVSKELKLSEKVTVIPPQKMRSKLIWTEGKYFSI